MSEEIDNNKKMKFMQKNFKSNGKLNKKRLNYLKNRNKRERLKSNSKQKKLFNAFSKTNKTEK